VNILELHLGDLIIIELALAHYLKGIDISMQAGQQCAAIIGKLEYQISKLMQAVAAQGGTGVTEVKA